MFDWLKPISQAIDVVDQLVEDKDQANQLKNDLEKLREQVYMQELKTQTIPWVDALHKMGRQIVSILNLIIPAGLLYLQPDIDPLAVAAIVGSGSIYNFVKGKGQ